MLFSPPPREDCSLLFSPPKCSYPPSCILGFDYSNENTFFPPPLLNRDLSRNKVELPPRSPGNPERNCTFPLLLARSPPRTAASPPPRQDLLFFPRTQLGYSPPFFRFCFPPPLLRVAVRPIFPFFLSESSLAMKAPTLCLPHGVHSPFFFFQNGSEYAALFFFRIPFPLSGALHGPSSISSCPPPFVEISDLDFSFLWTQHRWIPPLLAGH